MERITIKFPNGTEVQAETATPQEIKTLGEMLSPAPHVYPVPSLTESDQHRIVALLMKDGRENCILAIKFRRAITGQGLKESKDWFDRNFPARGEASYRSLV